MHGQWDEEPPGNMGSILRPSLKTNPKTKQKLIQKEKSDV